MRTWVGLLMVAACLVACVSGSSEPRDQVTATATMAPASPTPVSSPTISLDPTATVEPTVTAHPTPTVQPTYVMEPTSMITFTIVYDNQVNDPRLTNKWGFACFIETADTTILFDTGGDGPTLLENMAILGKDPRSIDAVVLSHRHGDHTGGVQGMLATGVAPKIYMLASFPDSVRRPVAEATDVVEVTEAQAIAPGIWTTGEIGGSVPEQALVVETAEGWVLVTGCAHPGIATMASRAIHLTGGPLELAIGGFHLGSASPRVIQTTIADLQTLGVAAVAPTHCTGDVARTAFAKAFGEAYFSAGAGASWLFEAPHQSEHKRVDLQ
jgi:7,8-dihydropterin-6-yl-methyl-4-(beta-D-ribofuranosyl)aminobenzene 5'-phosphate synthase